MVRGALVEIVGKGAPRVLGPIEPGALHPNAANPPVAHIILDRPAKRNALDTTACNALADAVDAASTTGARIVIISGSGGHFCAGADLSTVEDADFQPALRRCLQALVDAPIPVLLAIEGACLGAGVQLALAADLRVATPKARLGVPAAKLGLSIDHWTAARAAAMLGRSAAAHVLLSAEELSGQRAFDLGFVHRLGAPGDAMIWAGELARLAPLTLRAHKAALEAPAPASMAPQHQDSTVSAARSAAWASADLAEGKRAFTEKRAPHFGGE